MQLDNRLKEDDMLLRILAYGPAHTKKTWWAGKAAEAGYNVLLLDGDNNWHILRQIKPQAQKRIQVIGMSDNRGRPIFASALARLLKDGKLIWDEKEKQSAKLSPNANCINIDLNLLNENCVVVLDSWTAFCTSLMLQYAKENMIDLSVAEEDTEDKWGFYRWGGAIASWVATQLVALPCHIVVIAHSDEYGIRGKDKRTGKSIVVSTKRQIKSTSGPHAMLLPSKFPNMPYFYQKGTASKISTKGDETADGGCALFSPKEYNWDELQFKDFVKATGLPLPKADNPLINYSLPTGNAARTYHGIDKVATPNLVQPVAKPVAKIVLGKNAK